MTNIAEITGMLDRDKNPDYLNSFLDYSITILNKSPNSIKEYNYDISMFLKFMMGVQIFGNGILDRN